MRYFELWFDGHPKESICIRGVREPTVEEANQFAKADVEQIGGKVYHVEELSFEEASEFFDTSEVNEWPIFGKTIEHKENAMAESEEGKEKTVKKKPEQKKEMVNAPSHYCPNGVDSFMEYKDIVGPEPFRGFLQLNVMKYVQRYAFKGTPTQDLNKAFFYLAHLFFEMGGELAAFEATLRHAAKHYQKGWHAN